MMSVEDLVKRTKIMYIKQMLFIGHINCWTYALQQIIERRQQWYKYIFKSILTQKSKIQDLRS
jgi:hypothetical protein